MHDLVKEEIGIHAVGASSGVKRQPVQQCDEKRRHGRRIDPPGEVAVVSEVCHLLLEDTAQLITGGGDRTAHSGRPPRVPECFHIDRQSVAS